MKSTIQMKIRMMTSISRMCKQERMNLPYPSLALWHHAIFFGHAVAIQ